MRKLFLTLALLGAAGAGVAQEQSPKPMKAAVFLKNGAGSALDDKMALLNDLVASQLAEHGFAVIDPDTVATAYKASARPLGDENAGSQTPMDASPLRLAQTLGADYVVVAVLNDYAKNQRVFKGAGTLYGTNSESTVHTLRLSLKVLDGEKGAALFADTVAAAERVATGPALEISDADIVNRLLYSAARQIAATLGTNTRRIREAQVAKDALATFTVNCSIEGTTIELDGAALGTAPGLFVAKPGLHQMRVSRQWFEPWERTVNIFDGQILNVSLEMTPDGIAKFQSVELFKQSLELASLERETAVDIAKEQSAADAYVKKTVAEGEAEKRKNSYIRFDGDIDSLSIGTGDGGDNTNLINIVPRN